MRSKLALLILVFVLALPSRSATEANRHIPIDTTEGTWMSLDVSPDGQWITFDMLGDIYLMPIAGGEAKRLTPLPKPLAEKPGAAEKAKDAKTEAPKPSEDEQINKGQAFDCQPRFSPDGKQIVFISDRDGADNIYVMDVDGSHLRQVSTGQDMINSPAWSRDGKYIAVRHSALKPHNRVGYDGEVYVYRVEGGPGYQLTKTEKLHDADGVEFSADGQSIYFSSPGGYSEVWQIHRLDRDTEKDITITNNYGGAVRPKLSPDGKWMAYATIDDEQTVLRVRNLESGQEHIVKRDIERNSQDMYLTELDMLPGYAFSPDGQYIYMSYKGKIHRVAVADGGDTDVPFHVKTEIEIGPLNYFAQKPLEHEMPVRMLNWAQFTPDGQKAVFEALGKVWVEQGGNSKRLTSSTVREYAPSISPDGRWVAYVTWTDLHRGHVMKVSIDGGEPQQLTQEANDYANPNWSPDGQKIVVLVGEGSELRGDVRGVGPERELSWLSSSGGALHRILRHSFTGDEGGRFTADGTRLWFDAGSELHSVRLDGSDEKTHLKLTHSNQIVPSPDGTWVAFNHENDLWIMPMPWSTGEAQTVDAWQKGTLPGMIKISEIGGYFPNWVSNSEVSWTFAGKLFRRGIKEDDKPVIVSANLKADVPEAKGSVAFRGARIVTMKGDQVLEKGTIVVKDGRIVDVGPLAQVKVPSDAKVIDVTGKTIIPGMMDVHDHMLWFEKIYNRPEQYAPAAAVLAYGITTIRDPSTANEGAFYLEELINSGQMLGPRSYQTGQAVTPGEFDIHSLKEAIAAVDIMKELGAVMLKHYMQPTRHQRQLFAEASRREHIMSTSEGSMDFKHSLTLLLDGFIGSEHSWGHVPLYGDVGQLMAKSNYFYCPTIGVDSGTEYWYRHMDVDKDPKVRRFIRHTTLEQLLHANRRNAGTPEHETPFWLLSESAARMAAAGARVTVGSHDAPTPSGLGAQWELWSFVKGGMKPMEALKTATIISAASMGFEADLGSLETGKMADLLILDANPLENIENTLKINRVMKAGFLYDGNTLDEVWPEAKKFPPMWIE